jgi:sirohydrochlorin cobaltochelatase
MPTIREFLERRAAIGPWTLGQIAIDGLTLRHMEDVGRVDLAEYTRPEDARGLATFDDAGAYRPLKTAPNLRHGWRLRVAGVDDLRLALDFFYPAAIATWLAHVCGELAPVPLRETLSRQTGMYCVAQRISDAQAGEVIQQLCVGGCLRCRLWNLHGPAGESPASRESSPVILCAEACNLFVAACRTIAKQNPPPAE